MCTNCFENEIKAFDDKSIWSKFDLELTQKLAAAKLTQLKFINDRKKDKDDGVYIYQCNTCGQQWKLRDALYDLTESYFIRKVDL